MVRALLLSIRQLGDPAILGVLVRSLGLTLLIFVALGFGLYFGLQQLTGWLGVAISGGLVASAATIVALLLGWLLFRAIAVAVVGLFADAIVEAVERRHYPDAAKAARPVRFDRALVMGLGSAMRAVLVNLLLLPVYMTLLVTGVSAPLLFAAVNALLLGRDLGEMVAARHVAGGEMRGWLATTRGPRALVGLVATGLFVIPGVNLLAPVIGAALATHRFHGGRT